MINDSKLKLEAHLCGFFYFKTCYVFLYKDADKIRVCHYGKENVRTLRKNVIISNLLHRLP